MEQTDTLYAVCLQGSTTGIHRTFTIWTYLWTRCLRTIGHILKGKWIQPNAEDDDIINYVNKVHERLKTAKEIVYENMTKAWKKQKEWYDQKAWELRLQEGDGVMVLLLTWPEKLLAKWRGPYKIIKKFGKVNYEIELTDGRIRRKIFHINMLKPWKEAAESFLNIIEDEQEEITQEQQEVHKVQYGTDLMMEQRDQLQKMLKEFLELITKSQGRRQK